jgi:hypothetical protein
MERWQRRAMQKHTRKFLRELFEGEEIPIYTDPTTGKQVIDIGKVCEKLGVDPDVEIGKILTDPELSKGMCVITREAIGPNS